MLSLNSGRKIAIIDGDKKKPIFLKDDDSEEAEIETTFENKKRMFSKYLELDKKLSTSDIQKLERAYDTDSPPSELEGKLSRKYVDGVKYVENSLKKHLDYGSKTKLIPIIEEPSYRLFVSGLSGSGKSHFISMFIKNNRLNREGAGIFLFSPVQDDKEMSNIKNLIHLDLDEFIAESGKELEIEDIPEGSVCIFDDIESWGKGRAKPYMDLRDILLERGRHRDISTICVSHNAMNGHATKASIREAQYWCLFPKFNSRDTKVILKTYGGFDKGEIDEIMAMKTRWCLIRKSIPKYAIGEHTVIAY